MTQKASGLIDDISKFFWTISFALVPAVLLGMDFGFSVGIGYFVVAGSILSIHYDVQDIRKVVEQSTKYNQS